MEQPDFPEFIEFKKTATRGISNLISVQSEISSTKIVRFFENSTIRIRFEIFGIFVEWKALNSSK